MQLNELFHSIAISLGYDEPYDPRLIETQESTLRIGSEELRETVNASPGMKDFYSYANSDESYKLVDKLYIINFLNKNPVNNRVYVPIKNDCDDYAWILMGDTNRWDSDLAFGIVWSRSHAINWFMDTHKKVWYIEPQSDVIFEPTVEFEAGRLMI